MAALHQRPLQAGGLVESQSLPGTLAFRFALGEVDRPQCRVHGEQITLPHNSFRQRIRNRVEHVEHLAHTGVDVPTLQLGTGRVDREEVAL